jgi:hypothetical protein
MHLGLRHFGARCGPNGSVDRSRRAAVVLGAALCAACTPSSPPSPITASAASFTPSAGENGLGPATRNLVGAVQTVYARDRHLFGESLALDAVDGIVLVDGGVHTLLARERALADARHVRGVRAVIERVVVVRSFVADADLVESIHGALGDDDVTAPTPSRSKPKMASSI